MNYKELTGKTITEGFEEFNRENPHIYDEFEKQTLLEICKGKKKVCAKLIINWIRCNMNTETTDKSFKINDAFQSCYPRLFIEKNPEHESVFVLRKQRHKESGPYMMVEKNGKVLFI